MKRTIAALLMFTVVASGKLIAQEHMLIPLWQTNTPLKVPESVLYDAKNQMLYVTNIDGQPWEKDGKGSVGKVGLDGQVIAVDWVTGMHAPKGMALYNNKLYVADVEEVIVIDINKGTIINKIKVEGAQALNDITVSKNGVLYVSDSKAMKVHRIENDAATLHLEKLQGPNGVLLVEDDLYVLDNGGLYKVEKDKTLTKITDGMEGGTDGIEQVKGKEFIVSCWAGSIWYVKEDGTKQNLLDTREQKINTADIGYNAQKQIVYIPTFWKNSIEAYELK